MLRAISLKVMQRNPKPCAVDSCLNYLFGLCCLVLMTLLVKNTIKWLIGWCAAKDRLMLIRHFYFIYQQGSALGQKPSHFKMFVFSSWHLHFQIFFTFAPEWFIDPYLSLFIVLLIFLFLFFDNFLSFSLVIFMYILCILSLIVLSSWV